MRVAGAFLGAFVAGMTTMIIIIIVSNSRGGAPETGRKRDSGMIRDDRLSPGKRGKNWRRSFVFFLLFSRDIYNSDGAAFRHFTCVFMYAEVAFLDEF